MHYSGPGKLLHVVCCIAAGIAACQLRSICCCCCLAYNKSKQATHIKFTKVLMPVPAARVSSGWISEGTSQPRGPLAAAAAAHSQTQSNTQKHKSGVFIPVQMRFSSSTAYNAPDDHPLGNACALGSCLFCMTRAQTELQSL
jgi:hypothetical protein